MGDQSQGNDPPNGSQGDDAPKFVTEEQLNRAISARLGQFEKKQDKVFGDFGAKLEQYFSQQPPKDEDKQEGQQTTKVEDHPAFKSMQRQLEDTKKLTERLSHEKQVERSKARDTTLRQALQEKLAAGGVAGAQLKHALGFLVDAEKRVRFADDDSEEILFRDGQDFLPFEDGLRAWMKSDDAKIYLPPRGTNGSGSAPGQGSQAKNTGDMGQDAALLLMKHLTG